jgi:hypothetical protein
MAWNWPVITGIKKRLYPDQAPDPVPEPPPTPDPPLITPSRIDAINYLRAWLILRKIPFTQLRDELLKLPLKKMIYTCGVCVWVYMTYTFIQLALSYFTK